MRRKKLIALAVVLVTGGLVCGVTVWRRDAQQTKLIAEIAASVPVRNSALHADRFDALRTYLNDHSQHNLEDEFNRTWRDHPVLIRSFLATTRGERRDPVYLDCSTRSALMQYVLNSWGYRTRTVWVYSTSLQFLSHTFLDVLNPATGRW